MRKYLEILILVCLAALAWDCGKSFLVTSEDDGRCVSAEIADYIASSDNSSDCYTDWNDMAYSGDDTSISMARCPVSAYRVRVSGQSSSSQNADRSSFLKSGKIESVRKSLSFACYSGLFPTGHYSFSQHLISLRKMRI